MRTVPHHILDSDTLPHPSMPATPITNSPPPLAIPLQSDITSVDHPTFAEAQGNIEDSQGDKHVQQENNLL